MKTYDECNGNSGENIEMLCKIADSEETIIRFIGDDYKYDYTVTSDDKTAIKHVLELYDALN